MGETASADPSEDGRRALLGIPARASFVTPSYYLGREVGVVIEFGGACGGRAKDGQCASRKASLAGGLT